ncbi:stage II sporulation protein R [Lysinibacillus composti]|uniref:Stage II sporulation protein R n=1 Tax=Lysinibacillus composti TaxID=720633 RepID=A0A3N9UHP1_9BACI|nr:stage II sporulation protein R [Lysinibacillus composti]MBM7609017.1 stage II sporulation protein R [Lysinibacillus composti]RQW75561.1 hypothetical protein EBB45_05310 [Lysinibacillus composti]
MLNDYEIIRVENKKKRYYENLTSLLKLVACSLAVYCSLLLIPDFLEEVYETRESFDDSSLKVRVIANSNTNADQEEKLEVVESLAPVFKEMRLKNLTPMSNEEVVQELSTFLGKTYPNLDVNVKVGDHLTPPKMEMNKFYPQDYYQSLVVTIGSGRGDNFWCTIFANVCDRASDQDKDGELEVAVNDEKEDEEKEVKFIIWEWIKSFFA